MLNAEEFTKREEMKERIKFEEALTTYRSRLRKFINRVVLNNDAKWYLYVSEETKIYLNSIIYVHI